MVVALILSVLMLCCHWLGNIPSSGLDNFLRVCMFFLVFDPFFTTKFLGRGMGMAASYGIIKNHEGYIYIDSEAGLGTAVHIFLPCAPPQNDNGGAVAS